MVLSICIPSYNRFDELRKLLFSISQCDSEEFNVYIVDNGSNDDISSIGDLDYRFKIIKRDAVVPGPVNIRTSLDYGDGNYVLLCLDKDFIDGGYLSIFIAQLKLIDVPCGYCCLDSSNSNGRIYINETDIENTIYRCGHPSGYFFRREIIEEATKEINPYDEDGVFYNNPFSVDLCYAYGLMKGFEGIYNGALVYPETLKKASITKSYTYSKSKNNIYFMPYCKREQFRIFISHLSLLKIENKKKISIIARLYQKTLRECTFVYRSIMTNKEICTHHGIECEQIGLIDLFKEAYKLSKYFTGMEIELLNRIDKTMIICGSNMKVFLGRAINRLIGRKK